MKKSNLQDEPIKALEDILRMKKTIKDLERQNKELQDIVNDIWNLKIRKNRIVIPSRFLKHIKCPFPESDKEL